MDKNDIEAIINDYGNVQTIYENYAKHFQINIANMKEELRPFEELKFQQLQEISKKLDDVHVKNLETNFCMLEEEQELIKSFYSRMGINNKVVHK